MKILARYTLKEFFLPFLIALICFTCIILFDEMFRLTKLFVKKGVNPFYLIESLVYVMPATIVLAIPMAALVAILLTLGRFATDNEIIAMKAHGIAFHQLMIPLLSTTVLLSVVDLAMIEYVLPQATLASVSLKRDIRRHNPAIVLEEGTVMKELEKEGKLWMYESMDSKTEQMQNVKIWDGIWAGNPRFIHAQSATLGFEAGRAMLTLYDGHAYEPQDDSQSFRVTQFQKQRLALDLKEDLERSKTQTEHPQTMRIGQLKTHIAKLENALKPNKQSEYALNRLRYAKVEYHKKFALPFACLAFGLIGIPFGFLVKQNGRMIGFGLGLGVILGYYLLLQIAQNTGTKGTLPPMLAMWLPNLVVGTLGIALNIRMIAEGKLRTWRDSDKKLPRFVKRNVES